jgi:uncharacterized protein YbjT (DUF2867 family)
MNNYVIRVYRRNPDNLHEVAGIVENVVTCRQKSFLDMDGLKAALEDFIGTDSFEHTDTTQIDMYGFEEAVANG